MREIVVISGKGGTGKTSITAALASLVKNKVICDLDVDAADLHILLDPDYIEKNDFISGHTAVINSDKCASCGYCKKHCEFNAISYDEDKMSFVVNPINCEGCKVCVDICSEEAIEFKENHSGEWYISNSKAGDLIHAKLYPGEENSGLLVSKLREKAREIATDKGYDFIISDGSPGIGCPVIASVTGVDLAIIVTEPTLSGLHDLKRIVGLLNHFSIDAKVIINKYDISFEHSEMIESYCIDNKLDLIAKISYDEIFLKSILERKNVIEFDENSKLSKELNDIWNNILKGLKDE